MTSFPAIVNFRIMSSLTPGVVWRGQPARPPIQMKSLASTKMPCSRPGHTVPAPGPPQLVRSLPAVSNSSTGGAALARCVSGIDCGTCNTQMLSFRSTEIDVTSPRAQLFGICGQFGSTLNCGAFGGDCAPISSDIVAMSSAAVKAVRRTNKAVVLIAGEYSADDGNGTGSRMVSKLRSSHN